VQYAEQGQVIDSAIISQVNTEISLTGIASADIVMTGGGTGPGATAYMFSLQNIVYT
jgi:molybdopterin biosynthesis enzyme MoaB